MARSRSSFAAFATASLVVAAVALSAAPAAAAYDEFRPGAASPIMTSNGAWKPSNPTTRMAQPFIQSEDGRLASFSFEVNDIPTGHEIVSAAIHGFVVGVGPSAAPIAGGTGGTVSYAAGTGTKIWATIEFPSRPLLAEGAHYAVVIDPFADPDHSASFSIPLAFGATDPNYRPWAENNGVWSGYGNAHHLIFTSELVSSFGETDTPTRVAAEECDVEATVLLPESEGVVYESSQQGSTVTVTATAAEGYELAPDQTTSWTFDVAAVACEDESSPAEEEADERLPATGVDNGLPLAGLALLLVTGGMIALLATRTRVRA